MESNTAEPLSRGLLPRRGGPLAGFLIDSLNVRVEGCWKPGRLLDDPRCCLGHSGSFPDASGLFTMLFVHAARDRAREKMEPPAGRQSPAGGMTRPMAVPQCNILNGSHVCIVAEPLIVS